MTGLLLGAGVLSALIYLPMTSGAVSNLKSAIKTLPLLLFAVMAWRLGGPPFLVVGLLLSAVGDFALSRGSRTTFLYGLSAFALAHVLYTLAFANAGQSTPLDAFHMMPVAAIAMVMFGLSTEIWLAPHTDDMRWPVRVYVALIAIMMLAALTLPPILIYVTIGAALFVLSDLVLALQLFRLDEAHKWHRPAGWIVWICYIAGQVLIALGMSNV